jgi:hypothetical protein
MCRTYPASLTVGMLLLMGPPTASSANALEFHPSPFMAPDTGGLAGTIVNATGAPVARATVRCTNLATGAVFTQTTNAAGHYEWPKLAAGVYRVEVASPGFSATTVTVKVTGEQTAQSRIVLHAGSDIEAAVVHHAGVPPHPLLPEAYHPVPAPPPAPMPFQPPPPPTQPMPSHDHAHGPPAAPLLVPTPVMSPELAIQSPPPQQPAQGGYAAPTPDPNADYLTWLHNLPYGQIQDSIDSKMFLNTATTVTVTIGGQGAAPLPTASGSAPDALQVSPYMWVDLTDPDNPGGFDIEPIDTPQNPRHVVPGATTTWRWKVTPQQLGAMNLHVDAYIMQGQDASSRVSYGRYDKPVKVDVSWSEYPVNAFLWVLTNPGKSANWLLPGGGGAAIIVGIVAWWKKRKKSTTT